MDKLVILGASYLQVPLINKARELGFETHVIAWEKGAIGKHCADYFYPLSIREKVKSLEICRRIKPAGICSIGSDLAVPTVNYLARKLNLTCNNLNCTEISTDKYQMRTALSKHGLACPRFKLINLDSDLDIGDLQYPVIIKPTDRSGSRGISKVQQADELKPAIMRALKDSLSKRAILEEFIEGREISVEMISWQGNHNALTITDKVTTGPPYFVEIEHHQPALLQTDNHEKILEVTRRALNALGIEHGASHTELLITEQDEIFIVEVSARMAGDQIGSYLVPLSTGYDFMGGVIEIATNTFRKPLPVANGCSGIHYITPPSGKILDIIDHSGDLPEIVMAEVLVKRGDHVMSPITCSADRSAYFVYSSDQRENYADKTKIIEIRM